MYWYLEGLRNYDNFSGRASKSEFWYFQCGNILVLLGLFCMSLIGSSLIGFTYYHVIGIYFIYLFCFTMLIPSATVTVRRLHDTGRSGRWGLVLLIPFVGIVMMMIFLLEDSQPIVNRYGAEPGDLNIVNNEVLDDHLLKL